MFKVGDRVWDIRFGWGRVGNISKNSEYILSVTFEHTIRYYEKDGKSFKDDVYPSLFFKEIVIPKDALVRPI